MSDQAATLGSVRVVLRRADCEVLSAAARLRKQSLQQFVREVLEVAAVDLRTSPRVTVTWLDVYSRRSGLADDAMDDDAEQIRFTMPRPPRRVYLPTGPPPRNR